MFLGKDLMKIGNFPQRRLTILMMMGSLSRYSRIYRKVLEYALLWKNLIPFFYEFLPSDDYGTLSNSFSRKHCRSHRHIFPLIVLGGGRPRFSKHQDSFGACDL